MPLNRTLLMCAVVAAGLFCGCSSSATTPSPTPEPPKSAQVRFTLSASCTFNTTLSVDVYVDGNFKGNVGRGNSFLVELGIGNHSASGIWRYSDRANSAMSTPTTFSVVAGDGQQFNFLC